MKKYLTVIVFALLFSGCAHTVPNQISDRKFSIKNDTFSFSNETVWSYSNGKLVSQEPDCSDCEKYCRHCFVMSRAVSQFWKFARFAPYESKVSQNELKERIRAICRIDVWREEYEVENRITIPGYFNLRDFSAHEEALLKQNMGLDWPTYFRFGNTKMLLKPSEKEESSTNAQIRKWLQANQLAVVWVYRFPGSDINHCVLIYDCIKEHDGNYRYFAYDPNTPGAPILIYFDPSNNEFSFPKTFYFSGGPVSLRQVYLNSFE